MRTVARVLTPLAIAVALVVIAAAWLGITVDDLRHIGQPRNVLTVEGEQIRIPAPAGPATRQLPVVPVTTEGSHAFMFGSDPDPIRYDPCRPVDWVINTTGMPDAVEPLVHAAAQSVQRATGLAFVYQGTTAEPASFDRDLIQDQYGSGFAPIIVGFATEEDHPDLADAVTGIGGSSSVYGAYGDQQFLRSGIVVLDSEDLADLITTTDGPALVQAVIEHELAHVVGLAHVDDADELMNASNTRLTQWGAGDLQGLAVAGAGPCEGQ